MNQPEMRSVPKAAHTLALLSAIGLVLVAFASVICITNPAVTVGLFLNSDAVTELPTFTTCGMMGITLLPLPLMILAIRCICCKQISAVSAKLYAILFGIFLLLPMASGLLRTVITTLTAHLAGSEALVTLSAVQNVIGLISPVSTISYVLLGCSVAIIAYAATVQNSFPAT